MRILITGSSGLLGTTIFRIFKSSSHDVITHGYSSSEMVDITADLTNPSEVKRVLLETLPEIVINLCSLSDVDECEENNNKAYNLNVLITKNLCDVIVASNLGSDFIQISTDQIYNGEGPQKENQVKILNNYSRTKIDSENIALLVGGTVLRTNFFGKSECKDKLSFSDWVYNSLVDENIKYFNDVFFSPISMISFSKILLEIIDIGLLEGIYNIGSHGGMSKFQFALKIAEKNGLYLSPERAISIDKIKLAAKRTKGMIMDCSKLQNDYGIMTPNLIEEIEKFA